MMEYHVICLLGFFSIICIADQGTTSVTVDNEATIIATAQPPIVGQHWIQGQGVTNYPISTCLDVSARDGFKNCFYATKLYDNNDGRIFDFANASSACEEFRARLSTRDELEQMYEDGVRHCWCGWLADGTQGYVNQGKRDHCGNITGTFYDCNQTLAHAWCTVTGLYT